MDEIPQLIESAEQGDTEAARKILAIYHDSLYSETNSQTILIGPNGVCVDVRILAYLARCFRPIIEDFAGFRADANKSLNLTEPKRGAKKQKKKKDIQLVCYEIYNERLKILGDGQLNPEIKSKLPPLDQAIENVSKRRNLASTTVSKDYWKSTLNPFKGS